MDDRTRFLEFWAKESKTTSKVLSRIPEGASYKPDPKSRTAQEIAWAIVVEEVMLIDGLESGKMVWEPPAMPKSMKDVAAAYDKQSAQVVARLKKLPPAKWDGKIDFGGPHDAAPMAWGFLFDIIHHRGQISTYLRPMGAKVPQIYGPTADEP